MKNELIVSFAREDGIDCSYGEVPYIIGSVVKAPYWYKGNDFETTKGLKFGSPEGMIFTYYDWPPARAFEVIPLGHSYATSYGNKAQALRIVREHNLSEMILQAVKTKGDLSIFERAELFKIRNIPAEAMKILAGNKSFYVRHDVAVHPSCSAEIARLLAEDEEWVIRDSLAYETIYPEILEILSKDKEFNVRTRVAENIRSSDETLKRLTGDKDERVARAALFTVNKLNRTQAKIDTDFQTDLFAFS